MLDTDGNEEFIVDIVEELTCTVMDAIFRQYLEDQLLPFTVTLARDALTEIIEVNKCSFISLLSCWFPTWAH